MDLTELVLSVGSPVSYMIIHTRTINIINLLYPDVSLNFYFVEVILEDLRTGLFMFVIEIMYFYCFCSFSIVMNSQ